MQYVPVIEYKTVPLRRSGAHTGKISIGAQHVTWLKLVFEVERRAWQGARISEESGHFVVGSRWFVETRSAKAAIFKKIQHGCLDRMTWFQYGNIAVAHSLVRHERL